MSERYAGRVFSFHPEGGFGFLSVAGRNDLSASRVFFHCRDVLPDLINRRCIPAGSPVSFEIVAGRNGADAAVRVCNEDSGLEQIDPNNWNEFGRVRSWNGGWGYIARPSGDGLRFSAKNIVSEGIETIRVGTWLHYHLGNVENDDGSIAWFAKQISVCVDPAPEALPVETVEDFFASASELPLEEMPKPEASPLSIWSPAGRRMSLLDLIRRNKAAA